ncbi:MAG TPA: dephospho-CoA kinase [Bacteroidia bacterium]|nr:dephospho-CoA kinase [Bacteroidia bacterium]
MKKIGLTGGIGAGKSFIAKVFETLGVPVFYADEEAKKILNLPSVLHELSHKFGFNVVDDKNGLANRRLIAQHVFDNPEKLKLLNQIIHPEVEIAFQDWCLQHIKQQYILKEAAILFESGSYKNLDGVICVVASINTRVNRVMKRDNTPESDIIKRINNQWSDEQRMALSNWVINNDDNSEVLNQILAVHQVIIGY